MYWVWLLALIVVDILLTVLVFKQRKLLVIQATVIAEQAQVIQCDRIIIESYMEERGP